MQDLGEEHEGADPPLFLDQNVAGPHPLSLGLDDRPTPPPPPLSEGLDLPLDCNQFALKKERERAHASQIV